MNELFNMIILAIVQGLTEWLPISSSGHLVFVSQLLGFANNMEFDVAVHFGTLMAVFVYFGKDITDIVEAMLKGKWKSDKAQLGLMILLGSIPAGIIGILFKEYFEAAFTSLFVVALSFIITGMILSIASFDFFGRKEIPGWKGALFVGLAQALAIMPGISRSGSTIAAGLISKLNMKSALRFSFLLAIPAVFGANIVALGNQTMSSDLLLPTFIAFFVGLATIHLIFRKLLTTYKSLRWFAGYAFLLGIILLFYSLFG
ncbi:MAG: undecaprenyl-diphosphate phosphatase [Nanoarchaeota archaeon]